MGLDSREWALKWLKGSIISYMRDRTSSQILLGRVKRCLESYGVSVEDVKAIIESIILDPTLNLGSADERRLKLKPVIRFLELEESKMR